MFVRHFCSLPVLTCFELTGSSRARSGVDERVRVYNIPTRQLRNNSQTCYRCSLFFGALSTPYLPPTQPRVQGYLDSLPEPNVMLEAEIAASKERVTDLKGQLGKVTAALSEAKTQLLERKENKRIVDAAKSTASELAVRLALDYRRPGEPVLLVGRCVGSMALSLLDKHTLFTIIIAHACTHTQVLARAKGKLRCCTSTTWVAVGIHVAHGNAGELSCRRHALFDGRSL